VQKVEIEKGERKEKGGEETTADRGARTGECGGGQATSAVTPTIL